jgi:hypothetical protein
MTTSKPEYKLIPTRREIEMKEAERAGVPFLWGNVFNLSESAVEELGIVGARKEENAFSPHRASSGNTNRMTRKERKQHYTRKAILEREKEEKRRALWERRHPRADVRGWLEKEEERKKRKAIHRALRRDVRKKTPSSSNSGRKKRATHRNRNRNTK